MAARPEGQGPSTPAVASDATYGGARRMPVLNRRQFCRRQNVRMQRRRDHRDTRGRSDEFAPPEVALLRLADAMADTPSNVSDALYAELRRHFSEEQLIELAASAAQENFRARYNRVFDVGSDGLYRKGLRFKERRVA